MTCDINNQSFCFSCYSFQISAYIYLFNNTCVSSCDNSYFPSTTFCLPCISPCLTCIDSTKCLSCVDLLTNSFYFYYSINQSCL
jgi:hypothetical protein